MVTRWIVSKIVCHARKQIRKFTLRYISSVFWLSWNTKKQPKNSKTHKNIPQYYTLNHPIRYIYLFIIIIIYHYYYYYYCKLLLFIYIYIFCLYYLNAVKQLILTWATGGPLCQSLTWFLLHEETRSIATPPGWDASPSQGYPRYYIVSIHVYTVVERHNMTAEADQASNHWPSDLNVLTTTPPHNTGTFNLSFPGVFLLLQN